MLTALVYLAIAYCVFWIGALMIFAGDTRSRMERRDRRAKSARRRVPRQPEPAAQLRGDLVGHGIGSSWMAGRRFDLLRGLSNEQIDTLLALGRRRAVSGREQLVPRSDAVFLLLEGEVDLSVSVVLEGSKQHARVERARPGEMLGWMSLIPSSPWQRVAHAHGEATVLEFPRPELMALLASNPALASAIHSNLAARAAAELHSAWLLHLQREFDRSSPRRTAVA